MDTLTHALSGALLARATAALSPSPNHLPLARRLTVGALAAAFPDLDFVTTYLSPLAYLHYHRGVTHSLVMLPVWALLIGWLCAVVCRDRLRWRAYARLAAAGIAIHIAGDLITAFGTMIYAPLTDARYAWSTTFIIDLWFTGIILLGLIATAFWRRSRLPAVVGLAVLGGYVGFQYAQQQRAIAFGVEYAATRGMHDTKVSASPRPVSPFNWMVIVAEPDRYHYALVNLARRAPRKVDADAGILARLDAPYLPTTRAAWVHVERYGSTPEQVALAKQAYWQESFAFFRWFAAYPTLLRVDARNPKTCVWFQDLRFFTPGRLEWPFRYGMCREGEGPWRPYRLLANGSHVPVH